MPIEQFVHGFVTYLVHKYLLSLFCVDLLDPTFIFSEDLTLFKIIKRPN